MTGGDDPLEHFEDEREAIAEAVRLDARFRREIRESLADVRATQAVHGGMLARILSKLSERGAR